MTFDELLPLLLWASSLRKCGAQELKDYLADLPREKVPRHLNDLLTAFRHKTQKNRLEVCIRFKEEGRPRRIVSSKDPWDGNAGCTNYDATAHQDMCDARDKVIWAAKVWTTCGGLDVPWSTEALFDAVAALEKLEHEVTLCSWNDSGLGIRCGLPGGHTGHHVQRKK